MDFNELTKKQILSVQIFDIINFCSGAGLEDSDKIQKMFNIIHDNDIDYGTKKADGN